MSKTFYKNIEDELMTEAEIRSENRFQLARAREHADQ